MVVQNVYPPPDLNNNIKMEAVIWCQRGMEDRRIYIEQLYKFKNTGNIWSNEYKDVTLPVTLRGIAIVKETFLFHRKPRSRQRQVGLASRGANLSDPRTAGPPCNGAHRPMAPGRGSKSGSNGNGKWTVCEVCLLRLSYVPAVGAKAIYRSAGPLPQDVKEAVETGQEISPRRALAFRRRRSLCWLAWRKCRSMLFLQYSRWKESCPGW